MTRPVPHRSGRRKRLVLAASAALLLAIFAISVVAAQSDLGGKLRLGNDIRVPADETVATDLYVAGGTVTVDGTIEGDLVATGGTITLNGPVNGDVLAAGGTIRVGGDVTGDVRVAGGQVIVAAPVGEDGLVAGGQLELAANGSIGEDLILAGGQVTVAGNVTGSITGTAGTYSRTGQVGGSEDVYIQPAQPQAQPPVDQTPNLVADAFRHFLSVMLVGLVFLALAPRFMSIAEGGIRRRPLPVVGWGIGGLVGFIVLLIVIPIVTVFVAIVLGLLGFGGLVGIDILAGIVAMLGLILAFAIAAIYLGDAILGLALALLVARERERPAPAIDPETGAVRTGPAEERSLVTGRNILLMAIGVAVIVVLTSLPMVGGIFQLIVTILGLGAVLFALWWRSRGGGDLRTVPTERAAGWTQPSP